MQLEHNLEDSLAAPYLTYPILDPATCHQTGLATIPPSQRATNTPFDLNKATSACNPPLCTPTATKNRTT